MVLLIGVCLGRGLHVAQPTRGAQYWKDSAQRANKQTPPETCVYDKLPFVHSDVSALEVILLVGSVVLEGEGRGSRDLHR